jgi:hypothetical protein
MNHFFLCLFFGIPLLFQIAMATGLAIRAISPAWHILWNIAHFLSSDKSNKS